MNVGFQKFGGGPLIRGYLEASRRLPSKGSIRLSNTRANIYFIKCQGVTEIFLPVPHCSCKTNWCVVIITEYAGATPTFKQYNGATMNWASGSAPSGPTITGDLAAYTFTSDGKGGVIGAQNWKE